MTLFGAKILCFAKVLVWIRNCGDDMIDREGPGGEPYHGCCRTTIWYYKSSANLSVKIVWSIQQPRMVHSCCRLSDQTSQSIDLDISDRLVGVVTAGWCRLTVW